MNANALRNKLAAYQSVSVHGGVATEDPHRLVLMLMDGALERIAEARGCIEHGDIVRKAKLLSQAVHILTELRSSLDLAKGGDLAKNLDSLYDYMTRQLARGNVESKIQYLDEVTSLMSQIRSAWVAVPMALRAATPGQR